VERGVLRWVEAWARYTPELSKAGGLPLLLPENQEILPMKKYKIMGKCSRMDIKMIP
jgi:hypothetical protein